jgi:apolipoprotein N-acyltransferase
MGIPVILAAPVVWCGLEWFRKNWFLGGFALGSLEHTQFENTTIIQVADICGEYGVGMLIVFVGTSIGRLLPLPRRASPHRSSVVRVVDSKWYAVAGCVVVFILVVLYGQERLSSIRDSGGTSVAFPKARIALLQGNTGGTIDRTAEMEEEDYAQYKRLSQQAAPGVDLVVWPELACVLRLYDFQPTFVPENWKHQPHYAIAELLQKTLQANHAPIIALTTAAQTPCLLGVETWLFEPGGRRGLSVARNSAVLVDPKNGIGPRYDKINVIPFAEYNPLPGFIPDEYILAPSYTAGDLIPAFPIRSRRSDPDEPIDRKASDDPLPQSPPLWAAVNICYDSSFPHFIRRQVCALTKEGMEPDVLINISDDGLFRFWSQDDMHFATHVFRAIENRKQYLSATNAGQSAWIDTVGRIVKKGEKGAATYLVAEVCRRPATSLYLYWGDWLPCGCMCFNVFVVMWWGATRLFSIRAARLGRVFK